MSDSVLSIANNAPPPAYGRGDSAGTRANWGRQATAPSVGGQDPNDGSLAPPPYDKQGAVAEQASELDRTRSVIPGQRPEPAGNEEDDSQPQSPLEAAQKGELEKAVESINDFLQSTHRSLEFSVDDTSGRTIIKVMDSENDEVIRQIPPETTLALLQRLRDGEGVVATGLVDKA